MGIQVGYSYGDETHLHDLVYQTVGNMVAWGHAGFLSPPVSRLCPCSFWASQLLYVVQQVFKVGVPYDPLPVHAVTYKHLVRHEKSWREGYLAG